MNQKEKPTRVYQEVKVDIKVKLSALSVALMFCYTYADILGFYSPGKIGS